MDYIGETLKRGDFESERDYCRYLSELRDLARRHPEAFFPLGIPVCTPSDIEPGYLDDYFSGLEPYPDELSPSTPDDPSAQK